MNDTAIYCRRLTKIYPPSTVAVDGLDLEVRRGECFGLLGPNGAGKTTTIEILEGLLEPTSGEVEILGWTWARDAGKLRESIGISLQETRLHEKLSVRETARLFRSFYAKGLEPEEAIRLVGLEEKADSWVGRLSGGQRQRLEVACALIGRPELLFLDEPTTGLDPSSRRLLWDAVRSLRAEGRTVLLTTHYMEEAERLCDRVAIVDHGRLIACDRPSNLIALLGGDHVIEFTIEGEISVDDLVRLPSVKAARLEMNAYLLAVAEPHVTIPPLLIELDRHGLHLLGLTTRQASLEDVFVKLTGRHLEERDA
jgi:ABC-2 type transport system ATP-binding protein